MPVIGGFIFLVAIIDLFSRKVVGWSVGERLDADLSGEALRRALGGRYHLVSAAVAAVAGSVVRASSTVENLNSRLRNYFFLRRQLGPEYLSLLQFFLNHRRFLRSEHAGRVGKSPSELLTGKPHAHWLELLGYARSSRN
jgi:transposase InsO family protein